MESSSDLRLLRRNADIAFARAPLRIGLAGGGSDLSSYAEKFGGAVVNFAIERFVTAGCWIAKDSKEFVRCNSPKNSANPNATSEHDHQPGSMTIAEGTIEWFKSHGHLGKTCLALRNISQVSPGSGLGGSSAAVVACFSSVALLLGVKFSQAEIAEAAITIEREICGIPGGIQDFFPAITGGFRLIRNQGLKDFSEERIQVSQKLYSWLSESLFIVRIGGRPRGMDLVGNQIEQLKTGLRSIEAGHSVKELTDFALRALATDDIQTLISLFNNAWEAKRHFAQGTITQEMERLREICLNNGALAVKVAGAGGGGHLVGLVETRNRDHFERTLRETGQLVEAIRPIERGVTTWLVQKVQFENREEFFRKEARRSFRSLNL